MNTNTQAPIFEPKNAYETAIAKYLEANASDTLVEKIREAKQSGYNIQTCFAYIREQARKQAKNGCAMVEDCVVYGWAVHYFEDEWQAEAKKKASDKKKADTKREETSVTTAATMIEKRELDQRAVDEVTSAEEQAKIESERKEECKTDIATTKKARREAKTSANTRAVSAQTDFLADLF